MKAGRTQYKKNWAAAKRTLVSSNHTTIYKNVKDDTVKRSFSPLLVDGDSDSNSEQCELSPKRPYV